MAAPRGLPIEVEAALAHASVPNEAMVAVVQEVGSRRSKLAWQADLPVNPASLMKLITTLAGLELLGPSWTWNTPVWLQGQVSEGVLDGNLVIKGVGDPKLVLERLWLLLRRVQQMGVTDIRGDIVLDRRAFAPGDENPGDFDGEVLRPYNVRPDALLLNQKVVALTFTPDPARGVAVVGVDPSLADLSVDRSVPLAGGACGDWRSALKSDFADIRRLRLAGSFALACGEKAWSLAHPDAKRYNERALLGMWREMGGRLGGGVRDGSAPDTPPSFEFASPPLAEVVRDINKFSNNVMAQQLFLTLALTQRGSGTSAAAREVLGGWLQERFGALAAGARIDNGSGLSRDARASAQLLAGLLQSGWAGPLMPDLLGSLPVNGHDGTPRRSKTTPGRAHLKTGSLRDVSGVAGYVLSNNGRRHVLVAVINHTNANAARPAIDALVQWVINDPPPVTETSK